jgi:hypothetical protein
MPSLDARYAAGLEAQGWIETATHSSAWRRFGKFGRGAMYIWHRKDPLPGKPAIQLWFSELHVTDPDVPVYGPIEEQILLAGDKWLAQTQPDTVALLVELLDLKP